MSEEKKMKVSFAPGVLEELEKNMTPEELQSFVDDLSAKFNDPEFVKANAVPLDLNALMQESPEDYELVMAALDQEMVFPDPKKMN